MHDFRPEQHLIILFLFFLRSTRITFDTDFGTNIIGWLLCRLMGEMCSGEEKDNIQTSIAQRLAFCHVALPWLIAKIFCGAKNMAENTTILGFSGPRPFKTTLVPNFLHSTTSALYPSDTATLLM